jgi:hypothetical protein
MKTKRKVFCLNELPAAALLAALAWTASAAEPTAFTLIKEGNRYVGEQSKDKVVQIRSEKSIGTLAPAIWYIVYYDPDATLKATEVKFGAGQKLNVTRPLRLLEPVTGNDKMLDRSKLKIDSDKAIRIAGAEPLLASLSLKATQLWLQRGDEGPVWKVRLWAAKLKHPNDTVDIGDVFVSSESGQIVRADLHINRVD